MSTKPILFKGDMIRSILAGRKTQTRRLVKPQPLLTERRWVCQADVGTVHVTQDLFGDGLVFAIRENEAITRNLGAVNFAEEFAPVKVGDILWCRETWSRVNDGDKFGYVFRADPGSDDWEQAEEWTWHPSIFMPYDACRLFLKVTQVRVERLLDISEADAIAEGIEQAGWLVATLVPLWKNYMGGNPFLSPIASYMSLWNMINGADAHLANPFVWVYPFEVTEKPAPK